MVKLYGTSMSRASRNLWALEELGVKYQQVPVQVTDVKAAEHLKLNPNGHIPVLEDDGVIIWESMAINLYLAEKYGKNSLWPADVSGHGHAYQWSFWGITECEPHLVSILMNRIFLPTEQRSENTVKTAEAALKAPLTALDGELKGREYLVSSQFSIADLNVSSVLSFGLLAHLDFSSTPTLQAWLQKCVGRPANQKVRAMK